MSGKGPGSAEMNLQASAALSTLCTGDSSVIGSSAELSWNGFLLERQLAGANMRINDHADQHMLALVNSQVMRGEHRAKSGTTLVRKIAGQVTVIPKGPVPEMQLVSQAELTYCSFDEHFIERIVGDVKTLRPEHLVFRSATRDKSIHLLMQMLVAEFHAGNPTGGIYAETLAEALALRYLHLGAVVPIEVANRISALPDNKLARVKEFVESSLDQDLTLESLAREAGYSRAHFLRMFRESTGTTPHQYVMQRRIAHAEELLSANHPGVAEIAVACGFSSQAHLTLAFRKQTGLTPAEYRRTR
jgi:AraC family transcriptional regulator